MNRDEWPSLSPIDRQLIVKAVGMFLKTHRDGFPLLLRFLRSVRPDRTPEVFEYELAVQREAHARGVAATVDRVNAERAASGLPPLDAKGNVLAVDATGRKPS